MLHLWFDWILQIVLEVHWQSTESNIILWKCPSQHGICFNFSLPDIYICSGLHVSHIPFLKCHFMSYRAQDNINREIDVTWVLYIWNSLMVSTCSNFYKHDFEWLFDSLDNWHDFDSRFMISYDVTWRRQMKCLAVCKCPMAFI